MVALLGVTLGTMAIKANVTLKRKQEKALLDLEKFNDSLNKEDAKVLVGIPKGSSNYPDGTEVMLVALVHEFGSQIRNIPERSFLRAGIRKNAKKYNKRFADLALKVLAGRVTFDRGLNLIGLEGQSDVRQELTDLKAPPLKTREGNPLVDTGHLRQSITYQVVKNAGKR